jgi:uncharacterized membrane protein YcaP (DUF421 family)
MNLLPTASLLGAFSDWFATSWSALGGAVLSAIGIYLLVILYTRLAGVRSFAKMSGFDFAMTIATGSVLASTAMSPSVPLPVGATVMGVLFLVQWGLAKGRVVWPGFSKLLDNEPILVMAEGEVLKDNLDRSGVTRDDLIGKLREANVLQLSHVRAVIVETTGDVTVLHGDPEVALDDELFEGVRRREPMVETDD